MYDCVMGAGLVSSPWAPTQLKARRCSNVPSNIPSHHMAALLGALLGPAGVELQVVLQPKPFTLPLKADCRSPEGQGHTAGPLQECNNMQTKPPWGCRRGAGGGAATQSHGCAHCRGRESEHGGHAGRVCSCYRAGGASGGACTRTAAGAAAWLAGWLHVRAARQRWQPPKAIATDFYPLATTGVWPLKLTAPLPLLPACRSCPAALPAAPPRARPLSSTPCSWRALALSWSRPATPW